VPVITIPFKTDILALAGQCTQAARDIGAANTIYRDGDMLVADNTDGMGALQALEQAGARIAGSNCLILGNGGSARAIAFALLNAGARCTLAGRGSAAQHTLFTDLHSRFGADISSCQMSSLDRSMCGEHDIIINTTPLGMRADDPLPLDCGLLHSRQTVFDIVYTAGETPLLRQARTIGARTVRGLDMLLYQGLAQFERWTGQQAPQVIMRAALEQGFAAKVRRTDPALQPAS
jgi:shikimate dehydrogenase